MWSPTVPYNPAIDDPDSPTFGVRVNPTDTRHPVSRGWADLLNSRPTPNAPWTYVGGLDYLPNFRTETTTNVYQIIGGFRGDAAVGSRNWDWELYASHGKTSVNAQQPEGFPFLPRVQNLFNADQYGEGFDVLSLPGAVPLAVTGHCTTGLPIFNADGSVDNTPSVSQDCADWMVLRMNSITSLTQDVIEASVTGDLAELWAGELRFAVGVSTREENFGFDPDSGYNANQVAPNVVQNIILPVSVDGTTEVNEIFAELAIPLVRDRKLVQSFELSPGYRYSDYNTVGGIDTYKLTADWVVNDRVRVRGGHQFANRAPNVTELFTPLGGSQLGGGNDSCAYYPVQTPSWGNRPENPNRLNVQTLCQESDGRGTGRRRRCTSPGQASANTYAYNVFGGTTFFPFTIGVTEGNPGARLRVGGHDDGRRRHQPVRARHDLRRLVRDQAQERDRHPGPRHRLSAVPGRRVQPAARQRPGLGHRRAARGRQSVLRLDPARVRRRRAADAGQLRRRPALQRALHQPGRLDLRGHRSANGLGNRQLQREHPRELPRELLGVAVPRRRFHRLHGDGVQLVVRLPAVLDGQLHEQCVLDGPTLAAPARSST